MSKGSNGHRLVTPIGAVPLVGQPFEIKGWEISLEYSVQGIHAQPGQQPRFDIGHMTPKKNSQEGNDDV